MQAASTDFPAGAPQAHLDDLLQHLLDGAGEVAQPHALGVQDGEGLLDGAPRGLRARRQNVPYAPLVLLQGRRGRSLADMTA